MKNIVNFYNLREYFQFVIELLFQILMNSIQKWNIILI